MSKLDDKTKSMLNTLLRTTPDAGGWRRVSKIVWPLIGVLPDDLVEKRATDDGGFVRLTVRGQAVCDYF